MKIGRAQVKKALSADSQRGAFINRLDDGTTMVGTCYSLWVPEVMSHTWSLLVDANLETPLQPQTLDTSGSSIRKKDTDPPNFQALVTQATGGGKPREDLKVVERTTLLGRPAFVDANDVEVAVFNFPDGDGHMAVNRLFYEVAAQEAKVTEWRTIGDVPSSLKPFVGYNRAGLVAALVMPIRMA